MRAATLISGSGSAVPDPSESSLFACKKKIFNSAFPLKVPSANRVPTTILKKINSGKGVENEKCARRKINKRNCTENIKSKCFFRPIAILPTGLFNFLPAICKKMKIQILPVVEVCIGISGQTCSSL